jgi:flagellin-specific chaperone FliS
MAVAQMAMSPRLAANAYRKTKTDFASPVELVVMAYDLAIRAARSGDTKLFLRAIGSLKDSLDSKHGPESEKLAGRLLALYIYSEELVARGRGVEAARLLEELRDAWRQVSLSSGAER